MAYADYKDLIELTESLFRTLAQDILGKTEVTYGDVTLDFGKPFEKLTMREAITRWGALGRQIAKKSRKLSRWLA